MCAPLITGVNDIKKARKYNDTRICRNIRKFCPTVIGRYYWNDFPLSKIRNRSSKILFKKGLKKYYLAQYWLVCVRACLCFNNNMFLVSRQVHSYGTRSSELFYLPQCRTNIRKLSISFQGPNFFNSLSFEIRNATSTVSFCCKLKAFLLS